MDLAAIQAWFRALPQSEKVVVLLGIMWQFTLIMRGIALPSNDCEARWRIAYRLSELNHRFTSAASAMIRGEATYPDDVLMEILLEQQPSYPELEPLCREALAHVMRRHGKHA